MAFIPHIGSISISSSFYFDTFSVTLTKVFLLVGMDISMSRQLFSCLPFITMSGLLAFISRSVCIGISHKIVMLPFSVTIWRLCSYYFSSMFIFTSLQMFKCRYVAALSCLCRYSVLASPGHPASIWSMFSWN